MLNTQHDNANDFLKLRTVNQNMISARKFDDTNQ
jgi:hypothetical protein